MSDHYVLDANGEPRRAGLMAWAAWFETANRRIALDLLPNVEVSTVFLGLDHGFDGGPPVLWESMVFRAGAYEEIDTQRYRSRAAALAGHAALVERYRLRGWRRLLWWAAAPIRWYNSLPRPDA